MKRRDFLKKCSALAGVGAGSSLFEKMLYGQSGLLALSKPFEIDMFYQRPNILFAFADDWSWPHASIASDKVIKTPTFDRIAKEGVLFTNAFVTVPSCTPSRASVLTGQYPWRLKESANLHSTLRTEYLVYTDLLEEAGYHVGFSRKGCQPAKIEAGGRTRDPAGDKYEKLGHFLAARPKGKPFCYWFGSRDPHRPYQWRMGIEEKGMNPDEVEVPANLPDSLEVRTDICDYYWEVQRFDRHVGVILNALEKTGELDNTVVVVSSDNGMPFPRCKANLYDLGTHVPLAIRWPSRIKPGRIVKDFVSLADLAPTFLEMAGLDMQASMTGRSLMNILKSKESGWVDKKRDRVFTGRERHTWCRANGEGYPIRAVRTKDFLYIRNFRPQRWPAGDPDLISSQGIYSDVDSSPTKEYMLEHKDDSKIKPLFELAFGKRPAEELYDLKQDSHQINNVAALPKYAGTKKELADSLEIELRRTHDPRAQGKGDEFDKYPYYRTVWVEKAEEDPV